jgi:cytochrome P450
MSLTLPGFALDPFSDELLAEPYDYYRQLRDAGPVVHLDKYGFVAVSRFDDVRAALRDWRTFSSAEGVAFNDVMNQDVKTSILGLEPPVHDASRAEMTSRLRLSEIRDIAPLADRNADEMIAALISRGPFDAVTDLAEPFVAGVAGDLLGIPESVLDAFVSGSTGGFTMMGPINQRWHDATPVLQRLFEIMQKLTKDDMRPGSVGWSILDADERGEIPEALKGQAARGQLIWNFMGAAFDTTINAIGNIIWLLATHPEQWDLLRSDPSLIPSAINEGVRHESPIQIWSRFCPAGATVSGAAIAGGTRVAIMIGAANRDERHYHDPELFDIRRNPVDHLGFGHGIHLCVGAPLARIEITSVLTALIQRARSVDLAGQPTRRANNTTRGFANLPVLIS